MLAEALVATDLSDAVLSVAAFLAGALAVVLVIPESFLGAVVLAFDDSDSDAQALAVGEFFPLAAADAALLVEVVLLIGTSRLSFASTLR